MLVPTQITSWSKTAPIWIKTAVLLCHAPQQHHPSCTLFQIYPHTSYSSWTVDKDPRVWYKIKICSFLNDFFFLLAHFEHAHQQCCDCHCCAEYQKFTGNSIGKTAESASWPEELQAIPCRYQHTQTQSSVQLLLWISDTPFWKNPHASRKTESILSDISDGHIQTHRNIQNLYNWRTILYHNIPAIF